MHNPYDISFFDWFIFFITFCLGCLAIGFLCSLPRIIKEWAKTSLEKAELLNLQQQQLELEAHLKSVNERFIREWKSKGVR